LGGNEVTAAGEVSSEKVAKRLVRSGKTDTFGRIQAE
jgi:hypothetical protein